MVASSTTDRASRAKPAFTAAGRASSRRAGLRCHQLRLSAPSWPPPPPPTTAVPARCDRLPCPRLAVRDHRASSQRNHGHGRHSNHSHSRHRPSPPPPAPLAHHQQRHGRIWRWGGRGGGQIREPRHQIRGHRHHQPCRHCHHCHPAAVKKAIASIASSTFVASSGSGSHRRPPPTSTRQLARTGDPPRCHLPTALPQPAVDHSSRASMPAATADAAPAPPQPRSSGGDIGSSYGGARSGDGGAGSAAMRRRRVAFPALRATPSRRDGHAHRGL